MTEDERRNKLYEENRFYLELQHKHGGNFEAMLTPDELTIWNIFPDFHKSFFTYFKGQEWEIVSSLRLFSDETIVGKINGQSVKKSEQAKLSFEGYLQYRQQNKTTLLLHELQELLYPLRAFSSNLLQQEIAENLFYDASNPDIASWRDSQEWQQYGVILQSIPLTWLESKKSEYLRQCALVWRSYLPQTSVETNQITQNKRPSTDDKDQERCEIYQQVVNELGIKTHKGILLKEAANRAVCSEKTMRRAISPKR